MTQDSSAPATKEDVRLLRIDLHGFVENILNQMDKFYIRLDDMQEQIEEVRKEIPHSEDRMVQQFHVIAEQIHHDAIGANRDEIEVVKDRVARLERHTGLVKA